jgi:hydrogenase maturation protease
VGVHVAQSLVRKPLPRVLALEVGTAFLDALPAIEEAERIIVVDAMQAGGAPGTVYRVPFEDCARPECIASLHGFDLSRTMFLAGRTVPPEVIVIGVEPARIDWGVDLSPAVQDAVPAVLAAIEAEAAPEKS